MGFNRLLTLSKLEAQALVDRYWSQRDVYLDLLQHYARFVGILLPSPTKGFLPEDLRDLGKFMTLVLRDEPRQLQCPTVPDWLAEIHDPIDENKGFSNDAIWLGTASSYAFADSVLKTVQDALLTFGQVPARRDINKNQPVLRGQWDKRGVIPEVGLQFGRFIRGILKWRHPASRLYDAYMYMTVFPRAQGWVNEDSWPSDEEVEENL